MYLYFCTFLKLFRTLINTNICFYFFSDKNKNVIKLRDDYKYVSLKVFCFSLFILWC